MQGRHNVAAFFVVGISSQAAQYCFVPAARYPINPLQGRQAAVWGSGRASSLWCVPRARYYRHVTIVACLQHADSREPIATPHCASLRYACARLIGSRAFSTLDFLPKFPFSLYKNHNVILHVLKAEFILPLQKSVLSFEKCSLSC